MKLHFDRLTLEENSKNEFSSLFYVSHKFLSKDKKNINKNEWYYNLQKLIVKNLLKKYKKVFSSSFNEDENDEIKKIIQKNLVIYNYWKKNKVLLNNISYDRYLYSLIKDVRNENING